MESLCLTFRISYFSFALAFLFFYSISMITLSIKPLGGESIDSVAFKQKYHYWHLLIATDTIRLAQTPTNALDI